MSTPSVLRSWLFGHVLHLTDDRPRAPGYMTWDMIRETHAAGMDIQVHGREHHDMSGRDRDWLIFHLLGPAQTIHRTGYQPRFWRTRLADMTPM